MSIDVHELADEYAREVAENLGEAARVSRNEQEFRSSASRIFQQFADLADISLQSREEYTVASGRADTVYNRLVVEYKAPGKLTADNSSRANEAAIEQIVRYIQDIAERNRRAVSRMAGVVLDGRWIIFVRYFERAWVVDSPLQVGPESVAKLLKYLASVSSGIALIPDNLLADFGSDSPFTHSAVQALYEAISTEEDGLPAKLFEQWQIFFQEVSGYQMGSAKFSTKRDLRAFASTIGIDPEGVDPPRLIFALHTYFALIIKLIAWLAVTKYVSRLGKSVGRLSALPSQSLKSELEKLERGGIFREYGIRNLLEGDFFGWYLHVWNEPIYRAVQSVLNRLAEYDPGTLELSPEQTRDLLKKLYQYLMPRDLRHDLGEYYTPDWLAQLVLDRLEGIGKFEGDPRKRVLDPACGSGTFLVLAIKAIRSYSRREMLNEKETLDLILRNVVGIDLNPIAVIASRTNYLLAILDLLEFRDREIDIPVYLADSVLMPTQSEDIGRYGAYEVKIAVGTFRLASVLASRERVDRLASVLEESVVSDIEVQAFIERVEREVGLQPNEVREAETTLAEMYERVRELHRAGLDGIWTRVIKNAFAPLFLDKFDYVAGNPPWINWESLPPEYRDQSRQLWHHYGLFPHGGMDTILGKGKKDLSMLMTYSVMDSLLRSGGKLGFVITQSVFKTSGAGEGFREFSLPDGVGIRVSHVDDLVDVKPFEGATNRTAVMILEKGRSTTYPVPYTVWTRKKGVGLPSFESSLQDVKDQTERRRLVAVPVEEGTSNSPWLTLPAETVSAIGSVVGKADYRAREGSNTGGANAVYWVEVIDERPDGLVIVRNLTKGAKRKVDIVEVAIEPELLFPLVRGRDLQRWQASPSARILVVQDMESRRGIDERMLQSRYPRAYAYLKSMEDNLRERAAFRRFFTRKAKNGSSVETGPFYSMFGIGTYTFSDWKVAWREVSNTLDAAVLAPQNDGRPAIPDHTLIFVPCDSKEEAYYLSAVLNSAPARLLVKSYIVLHPDTHILNRVRIPAFRRSSKLHSDLARLGERAHSLAESAENGNDLLEAEARIDLLASQLWEITYPQLQVVWRALGESNKRNFRF